MTANIIVAPPHLSFHSSEPEQKFEVFNVHQFPVKFVVKATAPEKYIISNTEGMINTQCKVSITVTHIDVCVTNENVRDKFRIFFSVMKKNKFEPIGHRDISAVLYSQKRSPSRTGEVTSGPTHPDSSSPTHHRSHHHHHPSTRSIMPSPSSTPSTPPSDPPPPHPDVMQGHHLLVYLVPMALGVGALWLPTVGSHADTPWYLQISVATKHTICFFLGVLVTLFYKRVQQADR